MTIVDHRRHVGGTEMPRTVPSPASRPGHANPNGYPDDLHAAVLAARSAVRVLDNLVARHRPTLGLDAARNLEAATDVLRWHAERVYQSAAERLEDLEGATRSVIADMARNLMYGQSPLDFVL